MSVLDVRVEREFTIGGKVSSERDAVNDTLRSIRDALSREQMLPLLKSVGDVYYSSTILRFKSQTAPSGQKWAGWAEITKKLRKTGIIGAGGRVLRPPAIASVSVGGESVAGGKLIWTGRMIKAIKVAVRSDRASVQIGLSSKQVPYAWRHQMGYSKVPMRKFLGYTKKANDEARRVIHNYLVSQAFGITVN